MKAKVDKFLARGINCFVNRNIIYNYGAAVCRRRGFLLNHTRTHTYTATRRHTHSPIRARTYPCNK